MKAKIVSAVLAVSVILSMCSVILVGAQNQSTEELIIANLIANGSQLSADGEYYYKVNDDKACIKYYVGDSEEIVIPTEIDGYQVDSVIGGNSFIADNNTLKAVTFPEHLLSVQVKFENCSSLETVYYDVDGSSYPLNGSNLSTTNCSIKKLEFGNSVKVIPAFLCRFLHVDQVVFSSSVEIIQNDAFADAYGPKVLTIPANVKRIGNYAFYRNKGIEEVKYYGTADIPENCFMYCENLKKADLAGNLSALGQGAFQKCVSLSDVRLSNSIGSIGSKAFSECSVLDSVSMSCNVTEIGEKAFYKCSLLKEIELPVSLKHIGASAFELSGITGVTIPPNLEQIDTCAFFLCSDLTSVELSEGLTILGASMFCYSGISEIEIPESISVISASAFSGCSKLRKVKLGSEVTTIKYTAFKGCEALTEINFPQTLESMGFSAFEGCKLLSSINIPNVTDLGHSAFKDCASLEAVTLNDNITAIQKQTFYGCASLQNMVFPNNLKSIGEAAFQLCESLNGLSLPEGLERIEKNAFYQCAEIDTVVLPESITYVGINAFNDTAWYLNQDDGAVYTGKVLYRYKGTLPSNTDFVVRDGTKVIAGNAFISQKNLKSVSMPNTVMTICDGAFSNCTAMVSVNMSQLLAEICANAFYNCTSLDELMIPDSVTKIGDKAMYQCTSLKAVRVPKNLKSFGNAMDKTTSLEKVYGYPDSYGQRYASQRKLEFIPLNLLGLKNETGDIDSNGYIEILDATTLQRQLAEYTNDDGKPIVNINNDAIFKFVDADHDGVISISDVTVVQRYLAEFTDSLD